MTSTQPTLLCAWCGHLIRQGGLTLSHGICEPCADKVLALIDKGDDGTPAPPLEFPKRLPKAS